MNQNGKVNQYFLNAVWLTDTILPNTESKRENKRGTGKQEGGDLLSTSNVLRTWQHVRFNPQQGPVWYGSLTPLYQCEIKYGAQGHKRKREDAPPGSSWLFALQRDQLKRERGMGATPGDRGPLTPSTTQVPISLGMAMFAFPPAANKDTAEAVNVGAGGRAGQKEAFKAACSVPKPLCARRTITMPALLHPLGHLILPRNNPRGLRRQVSVPQMRRQDWRG